jgi:dolichol-phosphate mannosyltransferase
MNSEPGPENSPEISVVVPVHDEAENIVPLVDEIYAALAGGPDFEVGFEVVFVDDGSGDESFEFLAEQAAARPNFRTVRHALRAGQSAAIHSGVHAARGTLIATLDGDGQNDPADIPKLLALYRSQAGTDENGDRPLMIAGHRVERRDSWLKRISSSIANSVRARALGDATPDTGCGLKLFPRDVFLEFPAFDHMHRFLPALMIRAGGRVISEAVSHRARARGQSKYGMWDRLWVGIADLRGVGWLARRPLRPEIAEVPDTPDTPDTRDAGD